MEGRRELRDLVLSLKVFAGQRPACSGGEVAYQHQKVEQMPGQPALSFSLVVDHQKGVSELGLRCTMVSGRFVRRYNQWDQTVRDSGKSRGDLPEPRELEWHVSNSKDEAAEW